MLALPLPPALLDLLLSLSLTVSLLILLIALYTERPLDFSVFPSLLLMVTLFRLGLNVASTRLILLHGHEGKAAAGHVIQAFGDFTIGGNYVIGLVIFVIFLVINFVVITKGSGRIAEVAARFTLDALPGKQMAVDADVNHGVIDDREARRRRSDLQREADFYGAMDGASKFVRGDAIAGLVIMVINVLGGFGIGVLQEGMPLADAAQTYTLLTIGDGLVSQIPGLVISTAAGVVVSRAASGAPLAMELRDQIVFQPRALGIVGGMLGLAAILPGLPFAPFALLGGAVYWLSRVATAHRAEAAAAARAPELAAPAEPDAEAQVKSALELDELELEIGYQLVPLADPARGGELLARIRALRKQLAGELGFVVPLIHVRDNVQLAPDAYAILLRGNVVAKGEIRSGRWLALASGESATPIPGDATRDPAFGLPALWIRARERDRAAAAGYAVVDGATALTTHLAEVIRAEAAELLSRRHVRELLDQLAERAPKLVDELVPSIVSVSVLHRTLRQLLAERVSIRDLETILETLAEHVPKTQDADLLTDLLRQRLARTITRPYLDANGALPVLTLEPQLEERLRGAVQRSDAGSFFSLDAPTLEKLIRALEKTLGARTPGPSSAVLLCPASVRQALRQLVARIDARVPVVSHHEIPAELRLVGAGTVGLADAH
ncbi:MAG: flagellar biosynthesis protein FlhA [Proteobacteria bacterium]|nr:MAG: flagellar biosynthesis protein FlhA [Pseudomonadota bacterium]